MDIAPDASFDFRRGGQRVLLIACGALGREIVDLIEHNRWQAFDVACLPAIWHNTPQKIPEGLREKIRAAKGKYERILVAYGDCGTGGGIDKVLAEEGGIERIEGPHCYAFFSGNARFAAAAEGDDMTAFYLTDYLARHFDKLIWSGLLGLDRHPELRDDYFRHYTKVIYIAQTNDPALDAKAEDAAKRLGLAYERRFTGYGELADFMRAKA
jgi:Protein of unknown function (DUF1638)